MHMSECVTEELKQDVLFLKPPHMDKEYLPTEEVDIKSINMRNVRDNPVHSEVFLRGRIIFNKIPHGGI